MLDDTRELEVPARVAWEILTDVELWPRWGPSVIGVEAAPLPLALGTSGRVRTALGPWVPFEVTELDPGRSWAWRVAGIPATAHRVEPLGPSRCRVGFSVPWAATPYLGVCAVALGRIDRLAQRRV